MSPAVNPVAPRSDRPSSTNPFMDDTDALSPQSAPTLQPVKPLQPEAVDNTRDLFVCSSPLYPGFGEFECSLFRKTCPSSPRRVRLPLVQMSRPNTARRRPVRIGTAMSGRRVTGTNVLPASVDLANVRSAVVPLDVSAKRIWTSLPIPRPCTSPRRPREAVLVNADPVATPNPPSWNAPRSLIPRKTVDGESAVVGSASGRVVIGMASRRGPRDPSTWTLLTNWMSRGFMELAVSFPSFFPLWLSRLV